MIVLNFDLRIFIFGQRAVIKFPNRFEGQGVILAVFRIRIRSDPHHLAGSRSILEYVDPDLGKKKIVINSNKNEQKL